VPDLPPSLGPARGRVQLKNRKIGVFVFVGISCPLLVGTPQPVRPRRSQAGRGAQPIADTGLGRISLTVFVGFVTFSGRQRLCWRSTSTSPPRIGVAGGRLLLSRALALRCPLGEPTEGPTKQ
jgi:hypothetical protein